MRHQIFVTVHHTDFSDTDWQFTVRVNMVFKNLDVVRTVHWTKDKFFPITHVHGWEHVFLVMIPVTRSLVKLNRSKWWSVDVLVARSQLFVYDVAFQLRRIVAPFGNQNGKPCPTSCEIIKRSSSLPSLQWSRSLASSRI